jgi:aminoglycoside phosphotransferase (APT) family kinase protein
MHHLPTEQFDFLPRQQAHVDRGIQRGRLGDDALEAEVRRTVSRVWPSIGDEARLVHGDYWPGNTVFLRGRLSGVIDWEMAALGYPAKDVATCRCDLTNLFDLATADAFTRMYEEAAGRSVANLPFWDLQVATGALQYIDHWAEGYRALGRSDLSGDRAKQSVQLFARVALAKTSN